MVDFEKVKKETDKLIEMLGLAMSLPEKHRDKSIEGFVKQLKTIATYVTSGPLIDPQAKADPEEKTECPMGTKKEKEVKSSVKAQKDELKCPECSSTDIEITNAINISEILDGKILANCNCFACAANFDAEYNVKAVITHVVPVKD